MSAQYITSQEIHARIGASGWPEVLSRLGIADSYLRKKPGPCPACGGRDRFTFDNRTGHGDYFCRRCGAGDGFKLVTSVHGWTFSEARKRVMEVAGIGEQPMERVPPPRAPDPEPVEPAKPTQRVERILRESCRIEDCEPAIAYLRRRALWPLPKGHGLRAHPSVAYYEDAKLVDRFPALVGVVRDVAGEFVTTHITYLKPEGHERKMLGKLVNRVGCAVRLMQHGETLGVAEGIETAFSAARIHRVPTWATISRVLLAKFEPPTGVHRLVIFADQDVPGLEAAGKLMERLQGRVRLELKVPPEGDWNDVLVKRNDR